MKPKQEQQKIPGLVPSSLPQGWSLFRFQRPIWLDFWGLEVLAGLGVGRLEKTDLSCLWTSWAALGPGSTGWIRVICLHLRGRSRGGQGMVEYPILDLHSSPYRLCLPLVSSFPGTRVFLWVWARAFLTHSCFSYCNFSSKQTNYPLVLPNAQPPWGWVGGALWEAHF